MFFSSRSRYTRWPRDWCSDVCSSDLVSGVIRSLGARDATVIGQGLGGSVAWSMPALFPHLTRAIAALGMPHPLHLRSTFTKAAGPGVLKNLAIFQLPFLPERLLRRKDLAVSLLRRSQERRVGKRSQSAYW